MDSPYGNYAVIDTETGDLISATKKAVYDVALTEVAIVIVSQDLTIIDKASWLIKPYKEGLIFTKRAEEVSGISKQMVEEQGMDIFEVCKQISTFLKKYKYGSKLPTVVFHNMKFDVPFMVNLFEYCKDDLMKYVKGEPEDTLKWSRMAWTTSVNYTLGNCCLNAEIPHIEAHRAMPDAIDTAKLWIYFQNNLRGKNTSAPTEPIKKFRETFEL